MGPPPETSKPDYVFITSPNAKRRIVEKLWMEFFTDPSQWWDHRPEKGSARFPDFKHKKTQEALWLQDKFTPFWVKVKLAAMPSGTVQLNKFSWNVRLAKYVKSGQYSKTIELFQQMQREGLNPDSFTFVRVLNACAKLRALEMGRKVHSQIMQSGCELDPFVGSSLIDMYSKCGSIEDAQVVFEKMPTHAVVLWNVMILGYVKCGQGQKALELSRRMQVAGVKPDSGTFVAILKACASQLALEEGKHAHEQLLQSTSGCDVFVGSSLVDMYAKCGSIDDARRVFNKMPTRNVVSWNAMILGYVKCGQGQNALILFHQMQEEQVRPDPVTFVGILNACASEEALEEGRHVHKQIIEHDWESNIFIGNSLIDMYAKCGSIENAQRLFDSMPTHDVVSWNVMILGHLKCGRGDKALMLYQQMQHEGVEPDDVTFAGALNACACEGALQEGRRIHEIIIGKGGESDIFLSKRLIDMYVKCGNVQDAQKVFNMIPTPNVVSWNAMIWGHVKCGHGQKALELYQQMRLQGVRPDSTTFVSVLNACASQAELLQGKDVHEEITKSGFESDISVGNSLIDMYAKCGSIDNACRVFDKMPTHNVVSWNTMIVGYVKHGLGLKALELFEQMQSEGVKPDPFTFVGLLSACTSNLALQEGKRVHEKIVQSGCESDVFVGSCLVDMYAKCGSLDDGWRVFKKMPIRDVVSWNALIWGLVKCGEGEKVLELSKEMQQEGVQADCVTFVGMLNACSIAGALDDGRHVHDQIIRNGWESNIKINNSLIDMYAKCGSIEDASRVFNNMSNRDVVSWNTMIQGHLQCGEGQKARDAFQQMLNDGVEPNSVTFVVMLNACASELALEEGKRLHQEIVSRRYESDVFVGTCLIDMYGKCGSIEDACSVFNKMPTRDVISWNAIIQGLVKSGHSQKALDLYQQMQQEGIKPDPVTFVGVLDACASAVTLEEGKKVHQQIVESGYQLDLLVGSGLVDMYVKCGSMEDAWTVFNGMGAGSVFAWNAMLLGLVRCGQGRKALELSEQMQLEGLEPDRVTFVRMLNACANEGALEEGKNVHKQIIQCRCESNLYVSNSLVDMYTKCGSIEDALTVFNKMPTHDIVSWNTMITGLGKCGQWQTVLELSKQMKQEGVDPDPFTFVGLLNAAAGVLALDKGRSLHCQIIQSGCESDIFVGNCLVDMYAKCGSIEDSFRVFNKMPRHNKVSWNTLLGGLAMHGLATEALTHFELMCQESMESDSLTFVSVLSACNHTGLVDEGMHYFNSLNNVSATVEHYAIMVDLLSRAGRMYEAEDLIKGMANASAWTALLGACRVHGNVGLGEIVAKQVIELDPRNSGGYVLLSNICHS